MSESSQTTIKAPDTKTLAATPQKQRVTPATLKDTPLTPRDRILYLQRTLGNQAVQKLFISNQSSSDPVVRRQSIPNHRVKRAILGVGQLPSIMNTQLNDLAEQAKGLFASDPTRARIMIAYIDTGSAHYLGPNDQCMDDKRLSQISTTLESLGVPIARTLIIYPPITLDAPKTPMAIDLYDDFNLSLNDDYLRSGAAPKTPPLTQTPPAVPAGPSSSLSDLLTFKFKAGPVEFNIELPKSVTTKLPVNISASKSLAFELKAESSGNFSFTFTMNGLVPYFTVNIKAGVSVDKDKGTSGTVGIVFDSTQTAYKADNPEKLKADITKAGEKLKKAYDEYRAAATVEDKELKLIDMAGAIGDMYSAIEKAKAAAKPAPLFSIGLGAQGVLAPGDKTYSDPDPLKRPATSVGVTFNWNF